MKDNAIIIDFSYLVTQGMDKRFYFKYDKFDNNKIEITFYNT
nr:hypothetical protein TDPV-178 [Oriental turtle dovepox virus]